MELEKLLELLGMMLIAAVIIFFLIPQRAWGETSLLNLFGWQSENANDGSLLLGHKALHIVFDNIASSNLKVYEFHMTDQGIYGNKHIVSSNGNNYFSLKNWNKDKCNVFASQPTGVPTYFDFVYYVNPGAIIDFSCNSLGNCLEGRISSYGCDNICNDNKESRQPDGYSTCGGCSPDLETSKSIFEAFLGPSFGIGEDHCNDYKRGCPSEDNGGCCSLVKDIPNRYVPQYGLICGYEQVGGSTIDSNAKWFACTGDPDSRGRKVFTDKASGIQFKCENGKWVVSSDQGVQLMNPQIKRIGLIDEEMEVSFIVQNYRTKSVSNAVITLTPQDKNGNKPSDCTLDDSSSYRALPAIGTLKPPPDKAVIDEKNFCLDTRNFIVTASYTYDSNPGEMETFKISCPDATEKDKWYDCSLA